MPDFFHRPLLLGSPGRRAPVVMALLVGTVVVFVVQHVADRLTGGAFTPIFGLNPSLFIRGALWQVLTYVLLHASLLHILINMLMLGVFGPEVETVVGSRPFAGLYAGCGILAGIGWMLISGSGQQLCIGASGAVIGVAAAFAAFFPHRRITLLVFFVLPVTMTARTLVVLLGLIDLLALFSSDGNVAHAAHLVGGLAGYLYARRVRSSRPIGGLRYWYGRLRGKRQASLTVLPGRDDEPSPEEIDRILDKISRDGIGSLTRHEKRLLDRAGGRE